MHIFEQQYLLTGSLEVDTLAPSHSHWPVNNNQNFTFDTVNHDFGEYVDPVLSSASNDVLASGEIFDWDPPTHGTLPDDFSTGANLFDLQTMDAYHVRIMFEF